MLDAGPVGRVSTADSTFTLLVIAGGYPRTFSPSAHGKVVVHLPEGLTVPDGVLEWELPAGLHHQNKKFTVRAAHDGEYSVHVRLEAVDRDGQEFDIKESVTDILVNLSARGEKYQSKQTRTRSERVINGRRFRYDEPYPVFLDAPDPPGPIAVRTTPSVIDSAVATCGHCDSVGEFVVPLVVTVNPRGEVSWVAPSGGIWGRPQAPDDAVAAAREAVQRWRFRPAVDTRGRNVATWMKVSVTVVAAKASGD